MVSAEMNDHLVDLSDTQVKISNLKSAADILHSLVHKDGDEAHSRWMVLPTKLWSAEEEQRLLQLIRETGLTLREIAQKLGRTEAAVSGRLTVLRKRTAEKD
ncbi:hypothetical protein IC762_30475 [Bradyrhizobium genosp. L]|uniref:sigma factor-like helix-turn-helix DNA-binding protein n=1 Tax=Bradyrhizobium genosp. L TaxID=83637 RepID=UPI0018A2E2A2|nr:Myb-like DNA-binding domain-containing protein [Bradyrhizobium genosp. L]QPF88434.1 hypothetical protein IC762_30475 [Bradyrhizobium genosp. L]